MGGGLVKTRRGAGLAQYLTVSGENTLQLPADERRDRPFGGVASGARGGRDAPDSVHHGALGVALPIGGLELREIRAQAMAERFETVGHDGDHRFECGCIDVDEVDRRRGRGRDRPCVEVDRDRAPAEGGGDVGGRGSHRLGHRLHVEMQAVGEIGRQPTDLRFEGERVRAEVAHGDDLVDELDQ